QARAEVDDNADDLADRLDARRHGLRPLPGDLLTLGDSRLDCHLLLELRVLLARLPEGVVELAAEVLDALAAAPGDDRVAGPNVLHLQAQLAEDLAGQAILDHL